MRPTTRSNRRVSKGPHTLWALLGVFLLSGALVSGALVSGTPGSAAAGSPFEGSVAPAQEPAETEWRRSDPGSLPEPVGAPTTPTWTQSRADLWRAEGPTRAGDGTLVSTQCTAPRPALAPILPLDPLASHTRSPALHLRHCVFLC